MVTDDEKLAEALEQVRGALAAMGSGNPEPYIDCWAESEDVTLFGAYTGSSRLTGGRGFLGVAYSGAGV